MIREVIWVSGASDDYLNSNPRLASIESIDGMIELIRMFPQMGTRVFGSSTLRRCLVGRQSRYGLFYAVQPNRLIIVAFQDLTQGQKKIEAILKSRMP